MPKTETTINGLDAERLRGLSGAFRSKPELGRFVFHAVTNWVDGAHTKTKIQEFSAAGEKDTTRKKAFELESDEPDLLLGDNHDASPMETILHALGSSLCATFIHYASLGGITVDELSLDLHGEVDFGGAFGAHGMVRSGFQNIDVRFHVKADASPQTLEELCEMAQKRSPVMDIITHPVPVQVTLEPL